MQYLALLSALPLITMAIVGLVQQSAGTWGEGGGGREILGTLRCVNSITALLP